MRAVVEGERDSRHLLWRVVCGPGHPNLPMDDIQASFSALSPISLFVKHRQSAHSWPQDWERFEVMDLPLESVP